MELYFQLPSIQRRRHHPTIAAVQKWYKTQRHLLHVPAAAWSKVKEKKGKDGWWCPTLFTFVHFDGIHSHSTPKKLWLRRVVGECIPSRSFRQSMAQILIKQWTIQVCKWFVCVKIQAIRIEINGLIDRSVPVCIPGSGVSVMPKDHWITFQNVGWERGALN